MLVYVENYKDFFYNFSKKLSEKFDNGVRGIEKIPDRSVKFTCRLGYEFEILISNIQLLDYPMMLGDIHLNYLDRNIPHSLKGVRYHLSVLCNGNEVSKRDLFSPISKLCGELNDNFEALFGKLYLNSNFIRNAGKETPAFNKGIKK